MGRRKQVHLLGAGTLLSSTFLTRGNVVVGWF